MAGLSQDENFLIQKLNENWARTSFGYPIHEDLRVNSSVAEIIRQESSKVQKEAVD